MDSALAPFRTISDTVSLWGIRELSKRFGVRTLVGFTTNAFFIDLLRGDVPGLSSIRLREHPAIVNLRLTNVLFLILVGSVLLGVGPGIIFKFRGTTAGSDVIAARAREPCAPSDWDLATMADRGTIQGLRRRWRLVGSLL